MLTFTALSSSSLRVTGGDTPMVVFPADAAKHKDAIVLVSVPEEKPTDDKLISWPGEYNVGGVSIRGVGHLEGKQVSYVADPTGVRCAFLSTPLQEWTDKQMETVGDVDVLVLAAGDAKVTQKLVDEFDPRILILLPGEEKGALAAVEKAIGVKERVSEYKLKGSMPAEGREVIVLA